MFVALSVVGTRPIIVTGTVQFGDVQVIDATHLSMLDNNSEPTGSALVAAFGPGETVAAADINGDDVPDIIVGLYAPVPPIWRLTPEVKVIDGTKLADPIPDTAVLDSFFFQFCSVADGVSVAAQ